MPYCSTCKVAYLEKDGHRCGELASPMVSTAGAAGLGAAGGVLGVILGTIVVKQFGLRGAESNQVFEIILTVMVGVALLAGPPLGIVSHAALQRQWPGTVRCLVAAVLAPCLLVLFVLLWLLLDAGM